MPARLEVGVSWRLLLLLVFAAFDGPAAATAQLLGPEECEIGYQYRSLPEELNCRANITVTRLKCWVAIPTVIPAGTRVNVVWYWRSVEQAQSGSNAAFQVTDSPPFQNVNTICDSQLVCPNDFENLTVTVNSLEISHFEAALQGDYACRVELTNQSTGMVEEVMQPSACTSLQLVPGQVQNCEIVGQKSMWSCADTVQQPGECPQEFSLHPTTSVVTPTTFTTSLYKSKSQSLLHYISSQGPSSMPLLNTTSQSMVLFAFTTGSPTLKSSLQPPYSTPFHQLSPSPSTPTGTPTEDQSNTLNYIYIVLGVAGLLTLAAVGTVVSVIVGIRSMRKKRVISLKHAKHSGSTPTYVIAPGIYHDKGDNLNKSGTALRRNSTIYTKPTWPSHMKESDPKEHHYAAIPGEQENKEYSYAYQHTALLTHHQSMKQGGGESGKSNGPYQKVGTTDYIEMYSTPSPLLVSSEPSASPACKEEKGYTKLSSATLNEPSVYTKTLYKPED